MKYFISKVFNTKLKLIWMSEKKTLYLKWDGIFFEHLKFKN